MGFIKLRGLCSILINLNGKEISAILMVKLLLCETARLNFEKPFEIGDHNKYYLQERSIVTCHQETE